ncbi:MAG: EAL domain-containing protein, partial [Caulobacteraceae bacterium]|nr:EAL domain-containing protein [Caulobacter sp.]
LLARTLAALDGGGAPSSAPAAPAAPTPSAREAELLADLMRAIEEDRLQLVYQPQVDRDTETLIGVESLVRWTDPKRGPVRPDLFVPLAERYGMVGHLTRWVLDRALSETRDMGALVVAVNASALDFAEPDFVDRIEAALARHAFDPRRLEVEITETAILQDEERVRANMERLRALGVKMALDDFGVGYSSLQHLRRYPFDKLKIDREFIHECTEDGGSAAMVHGVIAIGRALGLRVIAEGVETEADRRFLRTAGVHAFQGWLFGRGVPAAELRVFVDEGLPKREAA